MEPQVFNPPTAEERLARFDLVQTNSAGYYRHLPRTLESTSHGAWTLCGFLAVFAEKDRLGDRTQCSLCKMHAQSAGWDEVLQMYFSD